MRVKNMTFVEIIEELLRHQSNQERRYLQRSQVSTTATKRQKSLLRELIRRGLPLEEKQFDWMLGL